MNTYLYTYTLEGIEYCGRLKASSVSQAMYIIEVFLGATYDGILMGEVPYD